MHFPSRMLIVTYGTIVPALTLLSHSCNPFFDPSQTNFCPPPIGLDSLSSIKFSTYNLEQVREIGLVWCLDLSDHDILFLLHPSYGFYQFDSLCLFFNNFFRGFFHIHCFIMHNLCIMGLFWHPLFLLEYYFPFFIIRAIQGPLHQSTFFGHSWHLNFSLLFWHNYLSSSYRFLVIRRLHLCPPPNTPWDWTYWVFLG